MDSKCCNRCKIVKPINDYYRHSKNRVKSTCKECENKLSLENYHKLTDSEKTQRSLRNRELMGKQYFKQYKLKTKYGLSLEQYENMLSEQDGKCCICNTQFTEDKKPRVDHNHTNGNVRGLLCHGCNTAIGHLREDTQILKQAISYLEKFNDKIRKNSLA
jgi:hypothetical protein